ncbi:hypothetical protein BO71DRAFT_478624 [Aspergillus ellipticus CBS 707.79]|uniref:Leucine-rich repeat domain-containing protein n=1 Tax=Aspergillus ellipticus CBS 707.79 TaxID=1448320 RepID=A0A319DGF3_9EURO|nr:hypothetical protein BO71DRAFT_478624 [Aspergillus ellipticus CBS 707.79]
MDRLPTEILLLIANYTDDRPSFRALSECCWRFFNIYQPFYYSSLDIRYVSPEIHIPLVQYLFQRPELAQHVRWLQFGWSTDCYKFCEKSYIGDWHTTSTPKFVETSLSEIFEADEDKSRWSAHLKAGCSEAWMGLLFTQLDHLERLELSYQWSPPIFHEVLTRAILQRRPFHDKSPFPDLQEVTVNPFDIDGAISCDSVRLFFYLPAVRKIKADGVFESTPFMEGEAVSDLSATYMTKSKVTQIEMYRTQQFMAMNKWIALCDRIEHLDISIGIDPSLETYLNYDSRMKKASTGFFDVLGMKCQAEGINLTVIY